MDEDKRVKNPVILGAHVCAHVRAELRKEQQLHLYWLENGYRGKVTKRSSSLPSWRISYPETDLPREECIFGKQDTTYEDRLCCQHMEAV